MEKKRITLNGRVYNFAENFTVFWLLNYLGFNMNIIVLDYNGRILQKELWPQTVLKSQDSLEILTVAGGG